MEIPMVYIDRGASKSSKEILEPLLLAIKKKDLDTIRTIVKSGCPVQGPGFNQQHPLHIAISSGDLPIIKYLIENGASRNPYTLENALNCGQLDILRYFIEDRKWEVCSKDYIQAFSPRDKASRISRDIVRYMFILATDAEAFYINVNGISSEDECFGNKSIQQEAIKCLNGLIDLDDKMLFSEIITSLDKDNSVEFLFKNESERVNFSLLEAAITKQNEFCFDVLWKIFHKIHFSGERYEDMDHYGLSEKVDNLFCLAIKHGEINIFRLLMAYALPDFERCFSLLNTSEDHYGFTHLFEYFSKKTGINS